MRHRDREDGRPKLVVSKREFGTGTPYPDELQPYLLAADLNHTRDSNLLVVETVGTHQDYFLFPDSQAVHIILMDEVTETLRSATSYRFYGLDLYAMKVVDKNGKKLL